MSLSKWSLVGMVMGTLVSGLFVAEAVADVQGEPFALPVRKDLNASLDESTRLPAAADPTTHPLRLRLPDPLRVRGLSPNFHPYPDAALFDNSDLLEAPAGGRGFVTVGPGGKLAFEDGTRARFWGVTITQEHIDVPKSRIEEVVDTLARAGCNMVRFHSLDNRAGEQFGFVRRCIIDESMEDTGRLDPEYLDRLHYWMARLKQRGIYSMIVLRGFRHYRTADGVPKAEQLPRGARPMAFFHPRLIELQKSYAQTLLVDTVNPYTGLAPANDPALGLVELFNEDSLFSRPDQWQKMLEPYGTELCLLWCDYLRETYGSDEGLAKAWQDRTGQTALLPGESLKENTVGLPSFPLGESYLQAREAATTDPLRSPPRRRDGIRFAIQLQRQYFRQLADHLTQVGVRVPMTGVVQGAIPADTFTVAAELDFTAENTYGDHPAYELGVEWNGVPFFRRENLAGTAQGHQWIAHASRFHWQGVPLAIREWTVCWPNPWRSTQMPEMAAYARFQDWDALLAFGYFTTTEIHRLSPFGIQNDPLRWGLFSHGARIFLGNSTVEPARHSIAIRWTPADLTAWGKSTDPIHALVYQHGIVHIMASKNGETTTPETQIKKPSLTILAGKDHHSFDDQGDAIIHGPVTAERFRTHSSDAETTLPPYWVGSGYPSLDLAKVEESDVLWNLPGSHLDDLITTRLPGTRGFTITSLIAEGLQPFGPNSSGNAALGGYDSRRRNLVLGQIPPELLPRIATEWMRLRHETPTTLEDLHQGLLRSDTGELVRDTRNGRVMIDTQTVAMMGGAWTMGTAFSVPSGRLRVISASPEATFVALSLDNTPLIKSRRFSLKMVTRAENRNQRTTPSVSRVLRDHVMLQTEGSAPIVSGGSHLSTGGASIQLNGVIELTAAMSGGTLEALVDLDQKSLFLHADLPNVRLGVELTPNGMRRPIQAFSLRAYQHETVLVEEPQSTGPVWTYPGWAKLVTLRWN